jgi:hypothetical protein
MLKVLNRLPPSQGWAGAEPRDMDWPVTAVRSWQVQTKTMPRTTVALVRTAREYQCTSRSIRDRMRKKQFAACLIDQRQWGKSRYLAG